jgi:pimeloyl-ACP methyl ester carboxylesterase
MAGTGAPPEAIEGARQSPWWPTAVRMAPTLAYDLALLDGGVVPRERLARIGVPVLALAGGDGAGWAAGAAAAVADAVLDGRAQVLEGQTHQVAPGVVAPVLRSFFAERVPV